MLPPKCRSVLFNARNDVRLARVQFALAGINAHIDHDLSVDVVETCHKSGVNLPTLKLVEDLAAKFGLRATREAAWSDAEMLWHAEEIPDLGEHFLDALAAPPHSTAEACSGGRHRSGDPVARRDSQ